MAYIDRELLRLIPRVLRARDFHLYLEGGKAQNRRLVDLWRQGGRAVLGHKPPRVLLELKNSGERGLFTPLPHPTERRFIKALELFFPGRQFCLYADEGAMFRALEEAGFTGPHNSACQGRLIYDPAFHPETGKPQLSLWRPFLEEPQANESKTAAILVPVLPWPLGPEVLAIDKNLQFSPGQSGASFPNGELIPPVLLAPAARSLYDLAALVKTGTFPRYPKIEKALGSESAWRRRGIYLTLKADMEKEEYKALFLRFLEGGFLLPPSQTEPAILPLAMSPGEESKLAEFIGS